VATEVVQKRPDVRRGLDEDDEQGIGVQHGNDGESLAELEYPGAEITAPPGVAKLRQPLDHGGQKGGQVLGITAVLRAGVNRKPIAAHHHHGGDPGSPAQGLDHVPDRRHTAPNLGRVESEVKQRLWVDPLARPAVCSRRMRVCQVVLSFAVGASSAVLVACNATILPPATEQNTAYTVTLYALHGTPITSPSAYELYGPELVTTALTPGFDFAFDIDSTGSAELLPLDALVPPTSDTLTQPGLQLTTTPFSNLTQAPTGGYNITTPLPVTVGDVVIIQSASVDCPDGQIVSLYAKLQVLAINDSLRTMQFQILVDENCGYFGLAPGLPSQ